MLHVVGRLPDGYHHLQSLVTFASVGDQIIFEKADAFRLTVDGPFAHHIPLTQGNSVAAAARWLDEKYPGIGRAHLHLTKNLPVASGMGGGSSDAAATLAILLQGRGVPLSGAEEEALILASGELGADVPMCLAYQLGWGPMLWIDSSGRETSPVPVNILPGSLPRLIALMNPGVSVSTPAVFKALGSPCTPPQDFRRTFERECQGNLLAWLQKQRNELMEPAMALEPKIGLLMADLQNAPGCLLARMSGSGATCFAFFEDRVSGQEACALFGKTMPQGWAVLCTLL